MKHRGWMICYKLWLETRVRFSIALGLNVGACLLYVLFYGHFYPTYLKRFPHAPDYQQYAFWNIFRMYPRGMFQFTGFLLGLSGWQRERSGGSLGFSLALPVSRLRQLIDRALFEVAQMVFIAFTSLLLVWALSNVLGHALPLSFTLLFATLWTIGGLLVFAITFFLSIVIPGEYTTVGAAYVAYMAYLLVAQNLMRRYPVDNNDVMTGFIGHTVDIHTLLWTGNVPVAILAGFLAASAILVSAGIAIGTRQEL
jgi:ABC-2 type transport system permease protein